jgi:hypothetical protein
MESAAAALVLAALVLAAVVLAAVVLAVGAAVVVLAVLAVLAVLVIVEVAEGGGSAVLMRAGCVVVGVGVLERCCALSWLGDPIAFGRRLLLAMIFPIFFFLSARICVLFADLPRAAYEYEPEYEPQNIQFWKVSRQGTRTSTNGVASIHCVAGAGNYRTAGVRALLPRGRTTPSWRRVAAYPRRAVRHP